MCYSGSCPFELWSGECKHKPKDGPFPCEFESTENYHKAKQNFLREQDDYLCDTYIEKSCNNNRY